VPLDKDTADILQQLAQLGAPDISELSPVAARGLSFSAPEVEPVPVASVTDQVITAAQLPGALDPGLASPFIDTNADFPDLPIRIYKPLVPAGKGALVYFHGGGWVLGDLDSHDAICRRLSGGAGITVIAVDYRLAPEAPYPAPLQDCYVATRWVAHNAEQLDIDPQRIAVGGDSAGGTHHSFSAADLSRHRCPLRHRVVPRQCQRLFADSSVHDVVLGSLCAQH